MLRLLLLPALAIAFNASAQTIPDSLAKKIDSLFSRWNNNKTPGCVVGVVRNDSLIFSKGYGLANIEYGIPNSPATIYHMASVSKQFTGYAIVLLARQGKLRLDDDVRKHLSWFPDLKEKITIRHLLNHTSGVRDQWQLLATSGTRLDDVITQDQIVKVLSRQQALNSKPGERYNYSNSGYTMLAEIVKSVTGQTLRKFCDSAIFRPLGMKDTHFHNDYTEVVKNRSYSYSRRDTGFSNAVLSYSNMGATSLFTNVNDMSKWVMNFYNPRAGDRQDIQLLTQKGKLNSGKELTYAAGIGVSEYGGFTKWDHNGGDAGYRTVVSVFPDLKMGFIIFSNIGDFSLGIVNSLADLFLPHSKAKAIESLVNKRDTVAAILKDYKPVQPYIGDYIGEEGLRLGFEMKNSKLHYYSSGSARFYLMPEAKDSFSLPDAPQVTIKFGIDGKDTTARVTTPDGVILLSKFQKSSPSEAELKKYIGTYYSPELDCKYGIILKTGQLFLTNNKYNDAKLTLVGTDHLLNDHWWMNHLRVLRNKEQEVTGFEINSGRILHVRFDKMQ